MATLIGSWGPLHTGFPLGTGRLLLLPIDRKGRQILASARFGLPLILLTDWPNHLNARALSALQDTFGINIACIQHMLAGGQITLAERLMDGCGLLPLGFGGVRGDHRGDEVRQVFLAGFAEMNRVAQPGEVAFVSSMGVVIVRRVPGQVSRREIVCGALLTPAYMCADLSCDPSQWREVLPGLLAWMAPPFSTGLE